MADLQDSPAIAERASDSSPALPVQVQPSGFLLELSPDWLILRASENVHRFLGEYPARMVGEPLASFTMAQPLHDLRNTLARQRSISGVARAYRVKLVDGQGHFDFAFQQVDGRFLLEGVPAAEDGFGVWMGSVSRLIDGLEDVPDDRLLDDAARRMRALGGFDRVILSLADGRSAESSRSTHRADHISDEEHLPAIIVDSAANPVPLFPREAGSKAVQSALLRAPTGEQSGQLRDRQIGSTLHLPLLHGGQLIGEFRCDSERRRPPVLELHAAAELFAQVLAMIIHGRGD